MAAIDVLGDFGPLLATGSFVSGLMCWRDLDVGALVGPDFAPIDVINVVARVVAAAEVIAFTYRDERGSRSPTGERRDERYHVPLWVVWNSSEWRFDLSLWLYDDHAHVADWHRQLGERISLEQRRAVLRIKMSGGAGPSTPTRSADWRSTAPCWITRFAPPTRSPAGCSSIDHLEPATCRSQACHYDTVVRNHTTERRPLATPDAHVSARSSQSFACSPASSKADRRALP
jgi:hypothetical protein